MGIITEMNNALSSSSSQFIGKYAMSDFYLSPFSYLALSLSIVFNLPALPPGNQALSSVSGAVQSPIRASVKLSRSLVAGSDEIVALGISADGVTVATGSRDGAVRVWNVLTGNPQTNPSQADMDLLPPGWKDLNVRSIAPNPLLNPTGSSVAVHDCYNRFVLMAAKSGKMEVLIEGEGRPLGFSPDGLSLLTLTKEAFGNKEELTLWNAVTGEKRLTTERVPVGVYRAYWSPDGGTIVVVGLNTYKTLLLDARTGRIKAKLPYGGCTPDALLGNGNCEPYLFSPDGRIVLKLKDNLKLHNADTGEVLVELESARAPAAFSPDGRLLLTRGKEKNLVLLWEIK